MKYPHTKTPLLLLSLLLPILAMHDSRQSYQLTQGETYRREVTLQESMRFTFIQTEGQSELKVTTPQGKTIANHQEGFAEGILPHQEDSTIVLTVSALTPQTAGWLEVAVTATREELRKGEEKWVQVRKGESRVIEIAPREGCVLTIERLEGTPQFINNRCQQQQRKECLDEMHRFSPVELRKHVETVTLEACHGCIILIKLTTVSPHARIRLSINAPRTTIPAYPTLFLIKKGETQQTVLKVGEGGSREGKVTVYSGAVELSSEQMDFERFPNGYTYSVKPETKGEVTMVVRGEGLVSYLMVEGPSDPYRIILLDGLPTSHLIQPNKTYSLSFWKAAQGRSNIVLSAPSEFLQRLTVKFTEQQSQEHYIIRPKYLLNTSIASQSFQLSPSGGTVRIELHLASGEGGFLNATCQVNEHISLPLDYPYSSILRYNEYDDYVLEGLSGSIDIHLRKCVDCVINYAISEEPITTMPTQVLQGTSLIHTHGLKGSQLYLRVHTTNYAYYSIQATKHTVKSSNNPMLPDEEIKFYLTEDVKNSLLLEMQPPQCGSVPCKQVTYYLMEGSDPKHLASKVYCPSALFDFDERTKDIVLEHIHPIPQGQTITHSRPMRHRDYLGVVAEVEGVLLPYRVISTEEVKLYHEMRWPFFYLCLFITAALFFTFMIFMALRRKGRDSGYVRASSGESQEHLG